MDEGDKPTMQSRLTALMHGSGVGARLVRGTMGAGGISVARLATNAGIAFMLGRLLGPAGYGSYAFFVANVALFAPMCTLGFDLLAARELSGAKATGDTEVGRRFAGYAPMAVWRMALVFCTGFVLISLTHNFYRGTGFELTIVLEAAAIALTAQLRLAQGSLRGLGRVSVGQFVLILPSLVNLVLFIAMLALFRPSAQLAIATFAAGTAIALPFAWYLVRGAIGHFPVEAAMLAEKKFWRRAAFFLGITQLANIASEQVPVLVTGYMTNPTEVGLLDMARRFALFASVALMVVNIPLGPILSELYRTGRMEKFQVIAIRSTAFAVMASLGLTIVYVLIGRFLLRTVDADFGASYAALLILCAGYVINTMTGPVQLALTMSGHERDSLKGVISALACNLVVSLTLTPFIGHLGGAIAGACGQLVWNLTLTFLLWKRLGIRTDIFALFSKRHVAPGSP